MTDRKVFNLTASRHKPAGGKATPPPPTPHAKPGDKPAPKPKPKPKPKASKDS